VQAPFFRRRVPCARCALTVLTAPDMVMWAPGGNGRIDCSGENRESSRIQRRLGAVPALQASRYCFAVKIVTLDQINRSPSSRAESTGTRGVT
jgi:hypothetical protein